MQSASQVLFRRGFRRRRINRISALDFGLRSPALVHEPLPKKCIEILLIDSQQAVDATVTFEPRFVEHLQLPADSMKLSPALIPVDTEMAHRPSWSDVVGPLGQR